VIRSSRNHPLLLLVWIATLAAVDWLAALGATLSWVIAGLLSLSILPWVAVVLRREPSADVDGVAQPRAARLLDPRLGSLLFHGVLLLLLLGFVAAKWLVLLHARDHPEEDLVGASRSYTVAILLVYTLGLLGRGLRTGRFVALAADHPARLMALSFGLTGVFGALVLSLPVSAARMSGVSLVDNLFMAFSAVCVTGLATSTLSQSYSLFGQVVLGALIQVGGLGIMVLSAAVMALSGKRMGVRSSAVLAEMVDASSIASLRRTLLSIVAYTLAIEAAGATVLYFQLLQHPAEAHGVALLWTAVFHAISAFCNAGFSNLHVGLEPFQSSPIVICTLALLILLGGIGFPVLDELLRAAFAKLRRRRLQAFSLNTRVVLRTSALLLVGMTVAYLGLEWNASMRDLSLPDRLMASLFQSVSCRSAGFNLVDIGAMAPAALVLTCAAMFIGASPGSTGGGIKTTTLAALFAGLRAELGSRAPRLLDRAVPMALIRKAIGVAFLSMLIVFSVMILMLLIEPHAPLDLMFEVVSAFSTTGLSTGITPELSVPGKLVIVVTMFVGRIGPLTLALALSLNVKREPVELPAERVMIG